MVQDTNTTHAAQLLSEVFGYDSFRGHQREIIDHVMDGKSGFVLMPTGGGKSLCYQIPAILRPGCAIIISPLIALMQDQVLQLKELNVKAATLNSMTPAEERYAIIADLRDQSLDMLYISPERLFSEGFIDILSECTISLFAIDEAHCVSQWGHDFRPEYARLNVLADYFSHIPRLALTATADERTRKDILKVLNITQDDAFISGFDRPNIKYLVSPKNNPKKDLENFIARDHARDSGIVYCLSRKKVDSTAEWLKAQGYHALPYHAGMSDQARTSTQEKFLKDEQIIIVATVAFGMGINKPDVRFVAHLDLPSNIESYYQETGRAGRDGLPAQAWMTYGMQDDALRSSMIESSNSTQEQKMVEKQKLSALLGYCEALRCRRQVLLNYFGDDLEPCGNCDICETPPESFDGTIAAQKALSAVYRTGQRFGVAYTINVLLGKETEQTKRFGHEHLNIWGKGAEHSMKEWQSIFRQLHALGLLTVDMEAYNALKITTEGAAFIKQKQEIALRVDKTPAGSKAAKREESSSMVERLLTSDQDKEIFQALREKRAILAKEQNIPPYVIFHDKTLIHMAKNRPQTPADLTLIPGVGTSKLDRYGDTFLDIIAAAG